MHHRGVHRGQREHLYRLRFPLISSELAAEARGEDRGSRLEGTHVHSLRCTEREDQRPFLPDIERSEAGRARQQGRDAADGRRGGEPADRGRRVLSFPVGISVAAQPPLSHSGPGQSRADGTTLGRLAWLVRGDGVHPELEVRSAARAHCGLRGADATGRGERSGE